MSWVIIVSITFVMLTMDGGIINEMLAYFGFEKINFLLSPEWFRPMYIIQVIWREAGWGTIIYLAAIASIDPQLYEAARMDGAGRIQTNVAYYIAGDSQRHHCSAYFENR